MQPIVTLPIAMPEQERDETGLTDRAYLDVLGRCISAALVVWLLFELALLDVGSVSFAAFLGALLVFGYLISWLSELLRQTFVYAGTWRYGVIS